MRTKKIGTARARRRNVADDVTADGARSHTRLLAPTAVVTILALSGCGGGSGGSSGTGSTSGDDPVVADAPRDGMEPSPDTVEPTGGLDDDGPVAPVGTDSDEVPGVPSTDPDAAFDDPGSMAPPLPALPQGEARVLIVENGPTPGIPGERLTELGDVVAIASGTLAFSGRYTSSPRTRASRRA